MGLCASKESTHRDVIAPQGDYHQQIEQEFGNYLQLDNPHNINTRYTYLYEPQVDRILDFLDKQQLFQLRRILQDPFHHRSNR